MNYNTAKRENCYFFGWFLPPTLPGSKEIISTPAEMKLGTFSVGLKHLVSFCIYCMYLDSTQLLWLLMFS